MLTKLEKLIEVKSIITITLTGVFAYLSVVHFITSSEFLTIFAVVSSFYFGTQATKNTTT